VTPTPRIRQCIVWGLVLGALVTIGCDAPPIAIDVGNWWDTDGDGLSNNTELDFDNMSRYGLNQNEPNANPSLALGKAQRPNGSASGLTVGTLYKGLNLFDWGLGYYHYNGAEAYNVDDWGTARLLVMIEGTGRYWSNPADICHEADTPPKTFEFGVGDLSRLGGGNWDPDHMSHQNGRDVDVRPIRLDGDQIGVDLDTPSGQDAYDDHSTEDLLFCIAYEFPDVDTIFLKKSVFNVAEFPGGVFINENAHNDHFHVRINDPDGYSN
jgi:hypothetical protein